MAWSGAGNQGWHRLSFAVNRYLVFVSPCPDLYFCKGNESMRTLTLKLATLLIAAAMCVSSITQENPAMSENERTIREFVEAWSDLDAEALASYFSEDGIYHNMPSAAVQGRNNIQQFIAGFIRPWESTDWEIISLLADGDMVMVERLDKTIVAGSPINLPCFGYFELQDGKITVWRDYFDLSTYSDALTMALQ